MNKTIPSQDLRYKKLLENPTCRVCGITKTVADFPKRAVDYACSDCRAKDAINRYHQRRARMSASELQSLKDNINARQNKRRAERLANMPENELKAWKADINEGNLRRRQEVRHNVYMAYGGYKCACCGETERTFLSIDHVNNDGAKHKRENRLHTGEQLYRWLARNNYPQGFQILCMNCQWGKRNNNGVCPHTYLK